MPSNPVKNRSNGDEAKKRILIYSKDPDFCISLALLFQEEYDVSSTTLLSEARDKIDSRQADLLVADSSNSLQDIYKHLEDIKRHEPSFPVVLLYVYRFENKDLEENLRRYVNALFYKPIDIAQLSKSVHSLLVRQ